MLMYHAFAKAEVLRVLFYIIILLDHSSKRWLFVVMIVNTDWLSNDDTLRQLHPFFIRNFEMLSDEVFYRIRSHKKV